MVLQVLLLVLAALVAVAVLPMAWLVLTEVRVVLVGRLQELVLLARGTMLERLEGQGHLAVVEKLKLVQMVALLAAERAEMVVLT
jgi:hypothetical protein